MYRPNEFFDFLAHSEHAYGQAAVAIGKTDAGASRLVRSASAICGWWADQLAKLVNYDGVLELLPILVQADKYHDPAPLALPILTSFDEISLDADGASEPGSLLAKLNALAWAKPDPRRCLKVTEGGSWPTQGTSQDFMSNLDAVLCWTIPDLIVGASNMALDKLKWSREIGYFKAFDFMEAEGFDPRHYCSICGMPYAEAPDGGKCVQCEAGTGSMGPL